MAQNLQTYDENTSIQTTTEGIQNLSIVLLDILSVQLGFAITNILIEV